MRAALYVFTDGAILNQFFRCHSLLRMSARKPIPTLSSAPSFAALDASVCVPNADSQMNKDTVSPTEATIPMSSMSLDVIPFGNANPARAVNLEKHKIPRGLPTAKAPNTNSVNLPILENCTPALTNPKKNSPISTIGRQWCSNTARGFFPCAGGPTDSNPCAVVVAGRKGTTKHSARAGCMCANQSPIQESNPQPKT